MNQVILIILLLLILSYEMPAEKVQKEELVDANYDLISASPTTQTMKSNVVNVKLRTLENEHCY